MSSEALQNIENIEDYLKFKYKFLESSPKKTIQVPEKEPNNESLDITIFRDLAQNQPKFTDSISPKPSIPQTSDPKINKLLSDVENIMQRALGGGGQKNLNDPSSNFDNKWGITSKFSKKTPDIENQEIRAYLKNLDSKLNIIIPKKNESPKKQNQKKPLKPIREQSLANLNTKKIENINNSESPFGKKSMYGLELSSEKKRDIVIDSKKIKKNEIEYENSPTKTSYSRNIRNSSRSIFEKVNYEKKSQYLDSSVHDFKVKNQLKNENDTIFCVNCEEFINVNKIDYHSKVCTGQINLKNDDNNYFIQNQQIQNLKNCNEKLNQILKLLINKLKNFENLPGVHNPGILNEICGILPEYIEKTRFIIHNKELQSIFNSFKTIIELFETLKNLCNLPLSHSLLHICEKIMIYCKSKVEILDIKGNLTKELNKNTRFVTKTNDNISIYSKINKKNNISSRVDNSPSKYSMCSEIFAEKIGKNYKKDFFKLGITMKLGLPKGHNGQNANISDIYLECVRFGINEKDWKNYLEERFNEMEIN